ncbi:hypothetical protein [Marinomonas sp. PE14-40]|uniref:hypothetical protein n=1 Tax=Marinomonas sp. PE14-40 TaxID=3060621 RepID=UPI003F664745
MQRVLFVWDARNAPKHLNFFINRFKEICSDYEIESRFLSFCDQDFNGIDRCQYGMRALLNAVHYHNVDIIISFGSQSNLLTKLIKPTLKVPLICNNLPDELEQPASVKKKIDRVTKTFTAHCNWSFNFNSKSNYYLPPNIIKETLNTCIGIIKSDPIGPVLANLVLQQGLTFKYINSTSSSKALKNQIADVDFMIISTDVNDYYRLSNYAASYGIPSLHVGEKQYAKIYKDKHASYERVTSTIDIELINKIKAWKGYSKFQKQESVDEARNIQSINNGINKFLDDLGFQKSAKSIYIESFSNIS